MQVLEKAQISSNLSFIELENFELKHISSSRKMNFSCLSSSFEMTLPSFGLNISRISSFVEFAFLKIIYHWTWTSSSLKFEWKTFRVLSVFFLKKLADDSNHSWIVHRMVKDHRNKVWSSYENVEWPPTSSIQWHQAGPWRQLPYKNVSSTDSRMQKKIYFSIFPSSKKGVTNWKLNLLNQRSIEK